MSFSRTKRPQRPQRPHRARDRLAFPVRVIPAAAAPRGGLVAHPAGAGKTVIAAALLERAARRDPTDWARTDAVPGAQGFTHATDAREGVTRTTRTRTTRTKTTLVTCPAHNQSVAGGARAFAPSLRCRRADARPRDARAAPEHDVSNVGLERLDADALPDWSPLRGGVQAWDVLAVANEDLPRGCRRKDDSSDEPPFHPLWNDPMAAPDPASIEWTRLIVDEPELLFDWRPAAAERGAGAWLVDDGAPRTGGRSARPRRDGCREARSPLVDLRTPRVPPGVPARSRALVRETHAPRPAGRVLAPRAPVCGVRPGDALVARGRRRAAVREAPDATFGDVVRLCGAGATGRAETSPRSSGTTVLLLETAETTTETGP